MSTIREKSGNFNVMIRKKGEVLISKTFKTLEDAKLFEFYKERLIDNMKAFDIPLENRITFEHLVELKIQDSSHLNSRSIYDFEKVVFDVKEYFKDKIYPSQISLKEWEDYASHLISSDVYRGAKTEAGKRKMSLKTWRRIFANISSVFSHARSKGVKIENHALTVLQTIINPALKNHGQDGEE